MAAAVFYKEKECVISLRIVELAVNHQERRDFALEGEVSENFGDRSFFIYADGSEIGPVERVER